MNIRTLLSLLMCSLFLFACNDDAEDPDAAEYNDWKNRNETYFLERYRQARTAIREAQATYGTDWEAHTPWRLLRTYAQSPLPEAPGTAVDTIVVCIEQAAENPSGLCPLYGDSVRISYMGRLIPTTKYPEGRLFDHTSGHTDADLVFGKDTAVPAKLAVSNSIDGFTTALLYMHPGDRWVVTIPWQLAYGESSFGQAVVYPAYSCLQFTMQLHAIYRKGTSVPDWK